MNHSPDVGWESNAQEPPQRRRWSSRTPQALKSLPANLTELRLVFEGGFQRTNALRRMFAGLSKVKRRLLPNLANVTLSYSQQMDEIVKVIAEDLKAADVKVTMDLQEQPRPLHLTMKAT